MSTNIAEKMFVCIPAYNEAGSIKEVIQKAMIYSSRVVVYDDGSSDDTYTIARDAGATVIRGKRNRGYGFAIRKLFQYSKENDADFMITLDSDGQHDPHQIPLLLDPIINDDFDIVIGSRFLTPSDREKVPRYRSFGIRTITKLAQYASYNSLTDAQSGFRAYSRKALSAINLSEEGMAVSTEILMRAKERSLIIKEVPVTITYDVEDTSSHNPLSHGAAVLSSLIQFIMLRHPLIFYCIPGIVLLIVAAFYTNNAMELYSSTKFISTNLILVSVGSGIVGVVLLATGTILYAVSALLKGKIRT